MATRISQAITGCLSEAEARRMVMEKQSAGIRAQQAWTRALLSGGHPAAASRAFFDVFNSKVQSNRKRLRKRRPR
jgi:hypothetical protein